MAENGDNEPDLENILPKKWKYRVINKISYGNSQLEISIKAALFSANEIKLWVRSLEEQTSCTYSVSRRGSCTGERILFKQFLNCHHNTRCKSKYDPSSKNKTKNLNCPSSLNITLKAVKSKFRGKLENAPDPEMPCIIIFRPIHNHSILSADVLRFRRVSEDTKQKLLELFKLGHSAASAREMLKIELQLTYDDYEMLLADRSICPDYNYCYNLFMKEFKQLYGPVDCREGGKSLLIEALKKYNDAEGEECAKINISEFNYVITLCPPLFKRIHENISSSSEIVFVDSAGTLDHDGNKVFILTTNSECGGLPLGLIITSSESAENITLGLEMLESILGNTIFNGKIEGPLLFMIDDCEAEHIAIKSIWPNSKCLLSVLHVLQSFYRWLVSAKNGIPKATANQFFEQFRNILYAPTVAKCEEEYEKALEASNGYENYTDHLSIYWQRRDMWAISFGRGNHTDNISEAAMRLLKEKMFNRVKAFNTVQLVDFLLTKFVDYYKQRLLDAAHNRLTKDKFVQTIKLLPASVTSKIQKLQEHVYLVPSEHEKDLHFIVYTDVLICTCFHGNTGTICKHIDWLHMVYYSEAYHQKIDSEAIRNVFLKIATGSTPPPEIYLMEVDLDSEYSEVVSQLEADLSSSISDFKDQTSIEGKQDLITEGRQLVTELSEYFTSFMELAPTKTVPALRKMVERAKKLKTVTAFVSSCSTFASAYRRKNLGARISVQPTAVARRKTNITGKSVRVDRRPHLNP